MEIVSTDPEPMPEGCNDIEVVSDHELFDTPERSGTFPCPTPLISTRSSMDVLLYQEEFPDPSAYMDMVVIVSDDLSSYHNSEIEDTSDTLPSSYFYCADCGYLHSSTSSSIIISGSSIQVPSILFHNRLILNLRPVLDNLNHLTEL